MGRTDGRPTAAYLETGTDQTADVNDSWAALVRIVVIAWIVASTIGFACGVVINVFDLPWWVVFVAPISGGYAGFRLVQWYQRVRP